MNVHLVHGNNVTVTYVYLLMLCIFSKYHLLMNRSIFVPLQGYMLATVQNNKIGSSKLASFNISFANLHAQLYFSRSFPVLYTESTKTVR